MSQQPIVLTNGQHEIKIYTVQNRGRSVFQLSYYEGGHRERKTFGKLSVARREAKLVLGRLAVNGHDAAELSTADMESYVVAKKHIESTGLPLHVCAETFAQAHAKLVGRSVSITDAVDFYLEFHRDRAADRTFLEMVADFAEGRRAMGVASDYVQNIKRQLGRLAGAYPGRTLPLYRTPDLDKWLGGQKWHPVTKNDVRKICITFGNWAKANGYVPTSRPTEFDGMMIYKEPATKVTEQLSTMALRKRIRAHLSQSRPASPMIDRDAFRLLRELRAIDRLLGADRALWNAWAPDARRRALSELNTLTEFVAALNAAALTLKAAS